MLGENYKDFLRLRALKIGKKADNDEITPLDAKKITDFNFFTYLEEADF